MGTKKKSNRIWEIDFLRGVLIIGMLIDHFMFFLGNLVPNLFGGIPTLPLWLQNVSSFAQAYWVNPFKVAVRYVGVALFFFLVGVSSRFSKSNLKRGILCTAFGVAMSIALIIVSKVGHIQYYALFPIITCLGVSMLSYWLFKAVFELANGKKNHWKWWSLVFGIGFLAFGFIMNLINSTQPLEPGKIFLAMMGDYRPGATNSDVELLSSDYPAVIFGLKAWGNDTLGLLPYVGFTFIGGFIGEHFYSVKKSLFFRSNEEKNVTFNTKALKTTKGINWLGGKTIWVYILHPIILVPIIFIVFWIACGRWPF